MWRLDCRLDEGVKVPTVLKWRYRYWVEKNAQLLTLFQRYLSFTASSVFLMFSGMRSRRAFFMLSVRPLAFHGAFFPYAGPRHASSSTDASGTTETICFFREGSHLNATCPSTNAQIVWSRPSPTLFPGRIFVPLCRKMMLPGATGCLCVGGGGKEMRMREGMIHMALEGGRTGNFYPGRPGLG